MIRALIVALGLLAAAGAHAQTPLAQAKEKAARLVDELDDKWKADRNSVTFRDLNAASGQIWASGDKLMILRLQNLWVSIALREKDTPREIGGRLLALLVHYIVDGVVAEDTAWANLALGQAYLKNPDSLREGAHYALTNAIAISEALERAGKGNDETAQTRARAHALIGQSFLQDNRPGLAIYHLRKAQALADAANFSKTNRDGVALLLSHAAEALAQKPSPESVACTPLHFADEAHTLRCIEAADRRWAKGDLAGVEDLLAGLTAETRCGSVDTREMDAFRSLHFARLLRYGPDSDALSFTVCGIAGRLNGESVPAWAMVVAWPLIHAHIPSDKYEQRTADVAAHTARRLMRNNDDALAWLALEATMAYVYSADKASDNPDALVKRRRTFLQPAIAYDMAYVAERNDWPALRDLYLKVGEQAVSRSNPDEIEDTYDALALYFDENYGFKVPTPVAAMELFARVARKLPASHRHHKTTAVIWPRLEQLYRSDEARAAKVAAANLALYRNAPDADPSSVASLLQAFADTASESEPDKALAARREALEILSSMPGREAMRIDLLFEVERDRRAMGDANGAAIYFQEAVALRRSTPGLDARTAARVDMRLAVRMFNEGDRTGARALAESALRNVVEATRGPGEGWSRYTPAKTLAEIVAADGDLARARALYEEYVFPFTDKAVAAGEAVPIDTRLDLASLEALYGPTKETLKSIQDLMTVAQRRAASAKDIQGRGWRSLAIANLGLDDGPAALDAARRAFALKPAMTSQVADEQSDRRLSETFVAAAWRAQAPIAQSR